MSKKITKIVLTGGPAGGKTTLISRILHEFKQEEGWRVFTIPETATELISGFGIRPFGNCMSMLAFQDFVIADQILAICVLKPAAAELLVKGVRLNALVLGIVQTEMAMSWMNKLTPEQLSEMQNDYPLGFGQPADIARIIAFLLGEESRWITGQTIVCDGGHSLM